jgi:hypothetical protein
MHDQVEAALQRRPLGHQPLNVSLVGQRKAQEQGIAQACGLLAQTGCVRADIGDPGTHEEL